MRDTTRLISRMSIVLLLRSFPSFVDRFIGIDFGRINGQKGPQENRVDPATEAKETGRSDPIEPKTKKVTERDDITMAFCTTT